MTSIPAGIGTGLGSMPGVDPRAAAKVVGDELDWPFLVELPARGPGADMIGRTAAVLVDIPMDTARVSPGNSTTYRLAGRAGRLVSRASGFLSADLDAAEEVFERSGRRGAATPFTISLCGPYTFAASVELASGHKVLHDRGAVNDVAASMAEGLVQLTAQVRRRLGASVIVQLDEPLLARVLDGGVRPLTRLDVMPEVSADGAAALLESMAHTIGTPMVLHDCATTRWDVVCKLNSYAVSLDLANVRPTDYDALGSFMDGGGSLVAGAIPTSRTADASAEPVALRLAGLIDRIGLPRAVLARQTAVSPACGLASADPRWAATALGLAARVGQLCREPDAL